MFHLADWPVTSEAANEARASMLATHYVNPLPAYHTTGGIIEPTDYKTVLPGTLARVTFTMRHWVINKTNIFVADVDTIRVLLEAEEPAAPKKRHVARTDPGTIVAKKKMKATT